MLSLEEFPSTPYGCAVSLTVPEYQQSPDPRLVVRTLAQRPAAATTAVSGVACAARGWQPLAGLSAVDHLGVRRLRILIAVSFQQRSVLLCCVLLAAVLAYMISHAEGIVDYALILGAGGFSLLLLVPQLVARRITRSQPADEHQQFEGMFMDAAIGMALTDADGRWIRANPAVTEMLGYREDELVGRCFTEFTHPDDRGDGVRRVEALRDGPRQRRAVREALHRSGRQRGSGRWSPSLRSLGGGRIKA